MPAQNPNWKQVTERGSRLGLRVVVGCYRLFGRPLAVALTHTVTTYFFLTDRKGRQASRSYLERIHQKAITEKKHSLPPTLVNIFHHYQAFALSILDRLIFWLGDSDHFDFQVEGGDVLGNIRATGRGAIFVGAHLGNFDALRMLATEHQVRVNVVMYTQHAPRINSVLAELSPDTDLHVIHYDPASVGSVFEIRACIERGEMVAILADRCDPTERTCSVPFLGAKAHFPQSPFLLAKLLRCPLVFMLGLRTGARRYRIVTEVLAEPAAGARASKENDICDQVAQYATYLENYCSEAPYQWFNFFDFWRELPSTPPPGR